MVLSVESMTALRAGFRPRAADRGSATRASLLARLHFLRHFSISVSGLRLHEQLLHPESTEQSTRHRQSPHSMTRVLDILKKRMGRAAADVVVVVSSDSSGATKPGTRPRLMLLLASGTANSDSKPVLYVRKTHRVSPWPTRPHSPRIARYRMHLNPRSTSDGDFHHHDQVH